MNLVPPFDVRHVLVTPWTDEIGNYGVMALMTFLVGATCGLTGNFLILRRMALVGDAISHSVLPGIAAAFLVTGSRGPGAMLAGAVLAALLTTTLIEGIHRFSRVKQDAAIGITFSSLFAAGVVLISLFADKVDLDQDCVLNGELPLIPLAPPLTVRGVPLGPPAVVRMACVLVATALLLRLFFKELLVSSFDPGLARSSGIRSDLIHHAFMGWLAITVVAAFEAVGAILVIAMLILPGATAALMTDRLGVRLYLSLAHAAGSAVLGMHLAVWLDCSPAGAAVVAGSALFAAAWSVSLGRGWLRRRGTGAGLETGDAGEAPG